MLPTPGPVFPLGSTLGVSGRCSPCGNIMVMLRGSKCLSPLPRSFLSFYPVPSGPPTPLVALLSSPLWNFPPLSGTFLLLPRMSLRPSFTASLLGWDSNTMTQTLAKYLRVMFSRGFTLGHLFWEMLRNKRGFWTFWEKFHNIFLLDSQLTLLVKVKISLGEVLCLKNDERTNQQQEQK